MVEVTRGSTLSEELCLKLLFELNRGKRDFLITGPRHSPASTWNTRGTRLTRLTEQHRTHNKAVDMLVVQFCIYCILLFWEAKNYCSFWSLLLWGPTDWGPLCHSMQSKIICYRKNPMWFFLSDAVKTCHSGSWATILFGLGCKPPSLFGLGTMIWDP